MVPTKERKSVLISGGSGMIGRRLTTLLLNRNYDVSLLSRKPAQHGKIQSIYWDPASGEIGLEEDSHFDYVIHLAGAGIADKRWTHARKSTIVESRTSSIQLLFDCLKTLRKSPDALISASAVGYYGSVTSDHIFMETDPPGNDFLARCCVLWEASAEPFQTLDTRLTILRTGVVLSDTGGMLEKVAKPVKYYAGSILGNGEQYIPWIHLDDLCEMYIHCMENDCSGVYNAAAPHPVTHSELMREIAARLNKPLWLPAVPAWVLKMFLGEMATLILEGSRVSTEKIQESGFHFKYPEITAALSSLKL